MTDHVHPILATEEHPPLITKMMVGGVTNPIGLVINSSNPLSPANGGTGVSNSSTLTWTASNNISFTTTGGTGVTLPTSGTLVNTAVTTLSNLVSIGTVTTGTWQATILNPTYGGTGINNGSNTLTLAGNLTTSGAFNSTFTMTGTTSVTFPVAGTLATVAGDGVKVTNVTGATLTMQDLAPINIYVINNASGLVTLTLPSAAGLGHKYQVIGSSAGGWTIAQGSGQSIKFQSNGANVATTTGVGGSLSSGLSTDCVELATIVASATFTATNMYGGSQTYV